MQETIQQNPVLLQFMNYDSLHSIVGNYNLANHAIFLN